MWKCKTKWFVNMLLKPDLGGKLFVEKPDHGKINERRSWLKNVNITYLDCFYARNVGSHSDRYVFKMTHCIVLRAMKLNALFISYAIILHYENMMHLICRTIS